MDPRAKRFLDMLAAGSRESGSIAERRKGYESLMGLSKPRKIDCKVEDRIVPARGAPVPIRLYSPPGSDGKCPGLIYFHGGGLVAGSVEGYHGFCAALAEASACRLVAVDYRLAPEHKFPAPVEDSLAATSWVKEHAGMLDIDSERIAVGGDSAGATLAAVTCQLMKAVSGPKLALQLLLCPVLDADPGTASRQLFAEGHLLDRATLQRDLAHYASEDFDPADPRVSPLRATDLSGLPRAIIHTAEFDPLRDEGRAYADRLALCGVEVSHTCHPGMIHHFYGMGSLIPYAREALTAIGAEVKAALG
jgi:acetyl esterase/lipase